jgi:hypothetical protein
MAVLAKIVAAVWLASGLLGAAAWSFLRWNQRLEQNPGLARKFYFGGALFYSISCVFGVIEGFKDHAYLPTLVGASFASLLIWGLVLAARNAKMPPS